LNIRSLNRIAAVFLTTCLALVSAGLLLSQASRASGQAYEAAAHRGASEMGSVLAAAPTETPAQTATPTPTATPAPTPTFSLYIPWIDDAGPPAMELLDAWVSDSEGVMRLAFLPGAPLRYVAQGHSYLPTPAQAHLLWQRTSPCGDTLVFSGTVTIPPGPWGHVYTSTAPTCSDIYTNTLKLSYTTNPDPNLDDLVRRQPAELHRRQQPARFRSLFDTKRRRDAALVGEKPLFGF